MLSIRSRVIVTIAIVVMLTFLLGYLMEKGSWSPDPQDWGTETAAVLCVVAIISVVVDLFRDRSSS